MKENYHKKMKEIILKQVDQKKIPTLLLHTCCAPCSTTVIVRLSKYFRITVFYYNPNIEPYEEYEKRKQEQKKFLNNYLAVYPISFLDCDWDHDDFLEIAKGYEHEKEGGKRCHRCYFLRLKKTAMVAKERNYDYFTTSLTVSPYKDSQVLNQMGRLLEKDVGISYLYSDFKKEDGYLESIQFSKEYQLYRQNYCGCLFSKDLD